MVLSPDRHRRIAAVVLVGLLLAAPAGAGPAPGSFTSQPEDDCPSLPCLQWSARHESPDGRAAAHHIALSPDGQTAYVVGGTFTWETSTDLVTWAVSVPTGKLLWSAAYDGPTSADEEELWFHDVRAITVSPDGTRVAVAGTSQGPFGHGHDLAIIVYDAATGQELWHDRVNGPASGEEIATGIVVDPRGIVVTGGGSDDEGDRHGGIVVGHDLLTGQKLWERRLHSPCGESDVLGLATTPASSDVYVGALLSPCLEGPAEQGVAFVPTILALDPATGAMRWKVQDPDPLLTRQSSVFLGSLQAAADRVYLSSMVTNPRNPKGDLDVLTLAADTAGTRQWTARYDSMGRDDLLGTRAAPDGTRLYVVAASPALATAGLSDQNQDIVVTAYDAAGGVVWSTRLDSSTTGLPFQGARLGGEGREYAPLAAPALLASGTRLALGYVSSIESPVPLVGEIGPGTHATVVLDTGDGSVAAARADAADLEESSYAAAYDRADFVGVGMQGSAFSSSASFRRLSLDAEPPVLDLPDDIVAEAEGSEGAHIVFTASAHDDSDGDVPVDCAPTGPAFPVGTTEVACHASDTYGNEASGSFSVTVQDTIAPTLHVPDPVAVDATGSDGARVEYVATARDTVDGEVAPVCSPAPGAVFPLGASQVTCQTQDHAGNAATASFPVTVTYSWTGFKEPLGDGTQIRQGRAVPVNVELTGASADVEDAQMRLWVRPAGGPEVAATGRDGGSNALVYDDGVYRLLWDTSTLEPGEHEVRLDLGDGTQNLLAVRVV